MLRISLNSLNDAVAATTIIVAASLFAAAVLGRPIRETMQALRYATEQALKTTEARDFAALAKAGIQFLGLFLLWAISSLVLAGAVLLVIALATLLRSVV